MQDGPDRIVPQDLEDIASPAAVWLGGEDLAVEPDVVVPLDANARGRNISGPVWRWSALSGKEMTGRPTDGRARRISSDLRSAALITCSR